MIDKIKLQGSLELDLAWAKRHQTTALKNIAKNPNDKTARDSLAHWIGRRMGIEGCLARLQESDSAFSNIPTFDTIHKN